MEGPLAPSACGGGPPDGDGRGRTEPAPSASAGRDGLVGTWVSAEGGAELVYVLKADGTYKHAGVLLQQRQAGLFRFTIGARGTFTVDRDQIVFRPQSGFEQIRDPDRPGRNRRDPIDTSPQRYTWSITGSSPRLTFTDRSGVTIDYSRR